ncbi:substrate-binding periplasmic protein [Thalassospira marina]|uniref:substrate-binding periplasmic protein n=1 Tax=Thalassospira marina TaxID=2048283 RepID=UPI0012FEC776|nr:transporter substrate-binding domain-containing protein [Thalassospira marina]
MRRIGCILVVLTGIFVPLSHAMADEVRLCFSRWEPYAYDDGNGATGLAIDIAKRAFEISGHDATFTQMPHSRCHFGIRYGIYDGILFESRPGETVESLSASRFALVNRVLVAVVRESYPQTAYEGLQTFEGANWLHVVDEDYPAKILNSTQMYPVDVGENAHGLLMLRRNYVDVVFRDLASLHFGSDAVHEPAGLKTLLPAVDIEPFYLCMESKFARVTADYDQAITKMLADGSIDRLYYKHLGFSQIAFNRYFSGSSQPTLPQDRLMP